MSVSTCPSCRGAGGYDVGDCEDGVWENCPECGGWGNVDDLWEDSSNG